MRKNSLNIPLHLTQKKVLKGREELFSETYQEKVENVAV